MIGTTQSLCPECMQVVPAKIITKGRRVYFRKHCQQHGVREDFVCSDAAWWDRPEGHTPSVLPKQRSTATNKGCPYDCGLCPEHEQHTCIGIVELTDACNLTCPTCYASSKPGLKHHSFEDIISSIDRFAAVEGRAEVCQLSGGEPTLHPQFNEIVLEALKRDIDYLMINTNGIRLANDPELVEFLAEHNSRVEVYLQFDGTDQQYIEQLRGKSLAESKLRALEKLKDAGLHVTLVGTLAAPIPSNFYEDILSTALAHSNVTGISLQPATYSGRHLLPQDLEQRVTFPDCIQGIAAASLGMIKPSDFVPLPCAHPNCHQILIAARHNERLVPLSRYADPLQNLDLLAGGISFTRERSQDLIQRFMSRATGCGSDCDCSPSLPTVNIGSPSEGGKDKEVLDRFFNRVLTQQASSEDILRITITSFLDAFNFDVRQLMKCCTHHVLPSGHVIPFCAYNTLYRPGHLPLPPLANAILQQESATCENESVNAG